MEAILLTMQLILQNYKDVQTEFPNAKVVASTFDRFVNEFLPYQKSLPMINSEIGDTWIHGSKNFLYIVRFYDE
jgi:hypothetical protein